MYVSTRAVLMSLEGVSGLTLFGRLMLFNHRNAG